MMTTQQVISQPPYYGMPTFPASVKGLTALVLGANGISGQAMLDVLEGNPERWTSIIAVARTKLFRPFGPTVQHISVDLLEEPEVIAKEIQKIQKKMSDYVFFFAYAQPAPEEGKPLWSNDDQLADINGRLLENVLSALELSSQVPKLFVLQTGGKTYGMHLGHVSTPWTESDPRVTLDNNFYYRQEDSLRAWCHRNNTHYNITIPAWILGATPSAAMNILYPLSIYAAIQEHLGRPLEFPGDIISWDKEQLQSTAVMNGKFAEWLALTPTTKDESFNIVDDYRFNWGRFWPVLADWYGTGYTRPVEEQKAYTTFEIPTNPRGYGPHSTIRFTYTLLAWAERPEVRKAWNELAAKHNITHDPFTDLERVWTPTNFALIGSWPVSVSMDKARKYGWHGYLDTHESIRRILGEMVEMNITPPVQNLRQ